MSTEWVSVANDANGFSCDFCEAVPVGYLRVRTVNRSLGGWSEKPPVVYMACPTHMALAGHHPGPYGPATEAVYPGWVADAET